MKNKVTEMTATYTYDETLFSDLYKDTYGTRPRDHRFYTASPAEKQEIWDGLMAAHEDEMNHYYAAQRFAVSTFESSVAINLGMGAPDRAAAIRWIMQAEDADDLDYLEYLFDLPYGYLFKETV